MANAASAAPKPAPWAGAPWAGAPWAGVAAVGAAAAAGCLLVAPDAAAIFFDGEPAASGGDACRRTGERGGRSETTFRPRADVAVAARRAG